MEKIEWFWEKTEGGSKLTEIWWKMKNECKPLLKKRKKLKSTLKGVVVFEGGGGGQQVLIDTNLKEIKIICKIEKNGLCGTKLMEIRKMIKNWGWKKLEITKWKKLSNFDKKKIQSQKSEKNWNRQHWKN